MNGQLRMLMLIFGLAMMMGGMMWMGKTQSYWNGGPLIFVGGLLFWMGMMDKKD